MKTWNQYLVENDFNELMNIISKNAGWIEPDGTVHSCSPMSHVDVLENLSQFADLKKYSDSQRRWELMTKRAYELGFIRVVINSGYVYVEGKRQAIGRQRSNLKDLASMLGDDAKIVPTYR